MKTTTKLNSVLVEYSNSLEAKICKNIFEKYGLKSKHPFPQSENGGLCGVRGLLAFNITTPSYRASEFSFRWSRSFFKKYREPMYSFSDFLINYDFLITSYKTSHGLA